MKVKLEKEPDNENASESEERSDTADRVKAYPICL